MRPGQAIVLAGTCGSNVAGANVSYSERLAGVPAPQAMDWDSGAGAGSRVLKSMLALLRHTTKTSRQQTPSPVAVVAGQPVAEVVCPNRPSQPAIQVTPVVSGPGSCTYGTQAPFLVQGKREPCCELYSHVVCGRDTAASRARRRPSNGPFKPACHASLLPPIPLQLPPALPLRRSTSRVGPRRPASLPARCCSWPACAPSLLGSMPAPGWTCSTPASRPPAASREPGVQQRGVGDVGRTCRGTTTWGFKSVTVRGPIAWS
jgi:hypothetical protein